MVASEPNWDRQRKVGFFWDDNRFPANGISIAGLSAPPGRDTATGLLLFDPISIETIAVLDQLPHKWVEGSSIRPHCHWAKTSDVAGTVIWTLRYKWWNNFETEPAAWSSIINATNVEPEGADQMTNIATFGSIDGTGKTISSLFLCQLGRLATADTYTGDAKLYEYDNHIQNDGSGSIEEFTK